MLLSLFGKFARPGPLRGPSHPFHIVPPLLQCNKNIALHKDALSFRLARRERNPRNQDFALVASLANFAVVSPSSLACSDSVLIWAVM